jgi:hypothetical protein
LTSPGGEWLAEIAKTRVRPGDQVLPTGPDNPATVPPGCEANVQDAVDSCRGGCIQLEG